MRSRGAKLRFCSYQFENIGRKLPAIRGCRNLPLALLDHCPDVVGKSTYGKVNLVCKRDVIRNAVEMGSPILRFNYITEEDDGIP
ncbi:hypothetical protein EVAR_79941_1 [Eumeta japonica]|uniref:Uncharacterized protein n=1 Tax=Eumeta variegata TaxID=151549 RepID=A0A4C1Y1G8_EUMVA|nr:hypothetical protein EVAR_79941_1 [Eumeta japonica]